jgi:hypothetical protein
MQLPNIRVMSRRYCDLQLKDAAWSPDTCICGDCWLRRRRAAE